MKKLLTKYYLLLALILLGAAGKTYALPAAAVSHAQQSLIGDSNDRLHTLLYGYTSIENYNLPHFEKQTDKIETSNNEEEEEELSLHKILLGKKIIASESAYLRNYYTPVLKIARDTYVKFCPSGSHFHSLSSSQYILYEVFRI